MKIIGTNSGAHGFYWHKDDCKSRVLFLKQLQMFCCGSAERSHWSWWSHWRYRRERSWGTGGETEGERSKNSCYPSGDGEASVCSQSSAADCRSSLRLRPPVLDLSAGGWPPWCRYEASRERAVCVQTQPSDYRRGPGNHLFSLRVHKKVWLASNSLFLILSRKFQIF